MFYNKFTGIGNLTRDPELRYLPSGAAICSFSIAMNHKYKTPGGEAKEEVCYLDVIIFGKYGENCHKYLAKGQSVLVDGRLRQRRWEEKDTHEKRNKIELIAKECSFGPRKDGAHSQAPEPEPPVDEGDTPF